MKKLMSLKNNTGFTLAEVLVVILIMGVVSTAAYQFFSATSSYMKSVQVLNDYQNITTNVIYQLRVELADCANAESFALDSVDDTGAPMYNAASMDPAYGYIVSDPVKVDPADGTLSGGGATVRGLAYDDTGAAVRLPDVRIGDVDVNRPYRVSITYRTEDSGNTNVGASIVVPELDTATGNYKLKEVYTQSTNIMLRSGVGQSGQDALRYKLAVAG